MKAHVKKKRERQRLRALAGFDPNGHAALQIQDFYRKYTKRLKNLAAEAKKRAHDEKLAAVWKSISGSGSSVDDGAVKF